MAWTSFLATACSFLLVCYSVDSCSSFSKEFTDIELKNASNYSRNCPLISVASEETCIKEFCRTIESQKDCHGDAIQLLKDGSGYICYILHLHPCIGNPDCQFAKRPGSKILISKDSAKQADLAVVCPHKNRCVDGTCLEDSMICDDKVDCSDGSDERDCSQYETCTGSDLENFTCKSDGKCVSASVKCDGVIDCTDGSDEMGCAEYWIRRKANSTLMITAISVGVILSLLLIVLMFACGQKLYTNHYEQRERLRNLRLGSSGADYVVRLLPGEAPFEDTLPPSYNDSILHPPGEEPPDYEPEESRLERLLDIAECSGYISPHSAKETQDTCSSEILSVESPGPSLEGSKLESDLVTENQSRDTDIG